MELIDAKIFQFNFADGHKDIKCLNIVSNG